MRLLRRGRPLAHFTLAAMLALGGTACGGNGKSDKGTDEPGATKASVQTSVNVTPSSPSPSKETTKIIEGDKNGLLYVLTVPKGYDKDKQAKWPLIVMLNGYGIAYSSLKDGFVAKAAVKLDLPFLTLSPHRVKGWDSPGNEVLNLIDDVSRTYRVDPSRVYLTGFSAGGTGTWNMAGAYPERFAAIAPITAGKIASSYVQNLSRMPIWAFHNEGDKLMPLADHQSSVDSVIKAGNNDVMFTLYPVRGHDAWTATYAHLDLYTWMLKHTAIKGD
jgi:predicted peptidase